MPSEKILEQKKQQVAALVEKLNAAVSGVIVDYKGINVADDTQLRKQLREAGVDYFVVKNTLLSLAADQAGLEGIKDVLEGTTAIAVSDTEYAAAAKILCDYAEKNENFKIKKGFVDGKGISKDEVVAYAKLPTKETLLAQLVFMLQSPIQKLAIAVSEIEKKQSESAE